MGHTNNKETHHLRPLKDFTKEAMHEMLKRSSLVQLAVLTGDTPGYLEQSLEGKSHFNVGKIIKYVNKGLLDEDFLSKFKVTATDNWQMQGLRSSSVSLAYYIYRKMIAGATRDAQFPKLVAFLDGKKGQPDTDDTPATEAVENGPETMLLVAFKGHNDQGIRYIGDRTLKVLQGLNPDVQFEVMANEHDCFVSLFRDVHKTCFKPAAKVAGTLTVRNAPAKQGEAQQKLFDNTPA